MIDGGVLSTVLVAAAGLLGWLYTQTKASSKEQRAELRWRREVDLLRGRRIRVLEQFISDKTDLVIPEKPLELVAAEKTGEEW